MKRSELKHLIKEAIADVTQGKFSNEQGAVVKQYLDQLRDFERNNTDDIYDLKNLITAVDMFHKELNQSLRNMSAGSLQEAASMEQDPYGEDPNLDVKADSDIPGQSMTEDQLNEAFAPETDEVGEFWIVEKPSNTSTLDDICFKCENVAKFANQVTGGLKPEDIKGVFYKEVKAKKLAEKLLADRDKKKDEVKKQAEAYKKMKEETLSKVQEYMKTKGKTKEVVDELKDMTDK